MKRPNKSALDRRKNFNVQYDAVTQNDLTPKDNVSYVIGPTEPPLVNSTVPQLLQNSVSRHGLKDALIFPNHRLNLL